MAININGEEATSRLSIEIDAKTGSAKQGVDRVAKSIENLADKAKESSEYIAELFDAETVAKAKKMSAQMRKFTEGWKKDTQAGLAGILDANNLNELSTAFSKLSASQVNEITRQSEENEKRAKDFAKAEEERAKIELKSEQDLQKAKRQRFEDELMYQKMFDQLDAEGRKVDLSQEALLSAGQIGNRFEQNTIEQAKKIADTMRSFNDNWEGNTTEGIDKLFNAKSLDDLVQGFYQLSAAQGSVITNQARIQRNFGKSSLSIISDWGNKAKESVKGLNKELEKINNIVKYRMIRSAMSMVTKGITEGLQSVYKFSDALGGNDPNGIAGALDRLSTKVNALKGNLGASFGTMLANLSTLIEPMIDKINNLIERITAFSSALAGNATYLAVSETYVKRFISSATSGLQDLTVIGGDTQYDTKSISESVSKIAEKVDASLSAIGNISGSALIGVGIMLIATGHVVSGIALAGAGLGISKVTNDFDDNKIKDKVSLSLSSINMGLNGAEVAVGLILLTHGNLTLGLPILTAGILGMYSTFVSDLNTKGMVEERLSAIKGLVTIFEISIGLILCCVGNLPWGISLLVAGLSSMGYSMWEGDGTPLDDRVRSMLENTKKIWDEIIGEIAKSWKEFTDSWKEFWDNPVKAIKDGLTSNNPTEYETVVKKGGINSPYAWNKLTLLHDWFTSIRNVIGFANGGFPDAGSLFLAGEVPGQAEMIGNINGRTGVASGEEITGIRQAIYDVGSEILANMSNGTNVVLEGDARELFRVVRSEANGYFMRTGSPAFES